MTASTCHIREMDSYAVTQDNRGFTAIFTPLLGDPVSSGVFETKEDAEVWIADRTAAMAGADKRQHPTVAPRG